jgi:hypothetical protein
VLDCEILLDCPLLLSEKGWTARVPVGRPPYLDTAFGHDVLKDLAGFIWKSGSDRTIEIFMVGCDDGQVSGRAEMEDGHEEAVESFPPRPKPVCHALS